MRFIVKLVSLIFFCSLTVIAQKHGSITVEGKIVDEETGAPLENVNIFLANTTIGTSSGKDGRFIILNIPFGSYNILFRYIGYKTERSHFYAYSSKTFAYNISLKQKPINLQEVKVTGTVPEDWKEDLEMFTKQFIGETDNSKETKILNPEVINFVKDKKTNTIRAYSDSLIKVENKALGYMLYIVLDSLVYTPRESFRYKIFPRFKELKTTSEEQRLTWEENRQNTYLQSRKRFFYALVHKQLNDDYYALFQGSLKNLLSGAGEYIEPEELKLSCNGDSTIYTFNFMGALKVKHYLDPPTCLYFLYGFVSIDEYGNLISSPYSVETYGYWAKHRVADLLPKNYIYEQKK